MSTGGLFQLVAYGAQDKYLYSGRFEIGQKVSWFEYLEYIEETIYAEIMLRVMISTWERRRARTVLLLKRKFEMETHTKWKEFASSVFNFFDYPKQPTVDSVESLKSFSERHNLRRFIKQNSNFITREQIESSVKEEPVVKKSNQNKFVNHLLDYYQKGKKDCSFVLIRRDRFKIKQPKTQNHERTYHVGSSKQLNRQSNLSKKR